VKNITKSKLLPVMGILMALVFTACNAAPQTSEATAAPALPAATATETILPAQTTIPAEPTATAETKTLPPTPTPAVEQTSAQASLPVAAATGALTAEEVSGLLYMREEEKLARDVYLALYEMWNVPIFENIAGSESTHTNAVKGLLDDYGLQDPAMEAAGVFTNADLQALYDELVETGAQSLEDALRVGTAIEEIDILDLEAHMAETDREDILRVYDNLLLGSYNHLRAFVGNLERRVQSVYVPQYLDQDAYEAILEGGQGRGNGRGQ
jgi:hypothetical protein